MSKQTSKNHFRVRLSMSNYCLQHTSTIIIDVYMCQSGHHFMISIMQQHSSMVYQVAGVQVVVDQVAGDQVVVDQVAGI